jgi:hypothetical protein
MKLYHVTSLKKFQQYCRIGYIKAPVRAWKNIQQAERMSVSTGRQIILRLKSNLSFIPLKGHFGQAVISNQNYQWNVKG